MNNKYDIITIGSATRDVYLESKSLHLMKNDTFKTGEGICIPIGSKMNIESLHFTTGGSSINTAVTFAQQDFDTAVVCKIGNDFSGQAIIDRLEEVGVLTDFLIYDNQYLTAYSIIIHSQKGDRSILVYRGASSHLSVKEFNFNLLKKTKWIYVSHLGGESAELFEPLIKLAHEHGVKIALNPGSTQLTMGAILAPTLNLVDILFVNQEEAAILTQEDFKKEDEIFKKLDKMVGGIAVMTKGPRGVSVSEGSIRWDASIVKEPEFIDRTGAGDAFSSGFTSAIMRGESVTNAIQLGTTNAAAVLGAWGANRGVLTKDDSPEKFGKLNIKETNL